ncbi:glycosyltransferase [Methylobacterium sp. Leaf113]|uniref:glycosyltransferase n=1 Tax=Methylobacterium sp. Leaf113 TaxID=1736259 RepID=UPI0009E96BF1|nr:glycosyltransferase [Methylobacterium sp. Leaf113]
MFFARRKRASKPPVDPTLVAAVENSDLFDPEWYVQAYPEVAKFKSGPLGHFCEYGIFEHRDPGPNFSTARYVAAHPDSEEVRRAPFLHALSAPNGDHERPSWLSDDATTFTYLLKRSGLFDETFYLATNRDLANAGIVPLDHFVVAGAVEGRDPGPDFESDYYAETYPEFSTFTRSPIEHYLRIGQRQGNVAKGPPRYQRWVDAFDTLSQHDLGRIAEDAKAIVASRITSLHRLDAEGFGHIGAIIAGYQNQVGLDVQVRFLRGPGIGDAAWNGCKAEHAKQGQIDFVADVASVVEALSEGDLLLLCSGASTLRPHASTVFALALESDGVIGAYADHDHCDRAGTRSHPVFKPAMSPEFMRRTPYAGSVIALRVTSETPELLLRSLLRTGSLEQTGADLLLDADARQVVHIPLILSHVLTAPARSPEPFYEPIRQGAPVQTDAPSANLEPADVPRVGIVIPTRDQVDLLKECIDSILTKTDYPAAAFDIVIVDNGSVEAETSSYLTKLSAEQTATIVPAPGPFNFAKICNTGAAAIACDILIFLNNDMSVIRGDWIRQLVLLAALPDVGVVGAKLLYPDGTIQHGGVVLGIQGVGAHRLVGFDHEEADAFDVTREMSAVTGACLAIRRDLFEELGGFDPALKVAFNDVKLCIDARQAGYRNLYVSDALLFHHESKSRGFDQSAIKQARNNREAIYVRDRYPALFQDDPYYNPNLSLQQIGKLATPPRSIRPWRRSAPGQPRVLLLSRVHGLGHGVAMVVAEQAAFLRHRGWHVFVGGPKTSHDIDYPGCERVDCLNERDAAAFAITAGIDCVIAHTPPFFSITRYLGRRPFVYFVDHGEPPPHLFPDAEGRLSIDWEKRLCAPLARRVFTISQTIKDQQYRKDAIVIRNGNSHLSTWSDDWSRQRKELRRKFGFEGRFVVFNVARFGEAERHYKGIDSYMELAAEAQFHADPHRAPPLFVLAGRADASDEAYVSAIGILVFKNVSDAEMAELYAATDLFVSLSRWEGYNLCIGQARAMGLPVVASDIEAHREFEVGTANLIPLLVQKVHEHASCWNENVLHRDVLIEPWDRPLTLMSDTIEADLHDAGAARWFRSSGDID